MKLRLINTIILFLTLNFSTAQSWNQLKNDYNDLLKADKNDLAVKKATDMLSWAYKNEGDTSLNVAISYKLIGNAYVVGNVLRTWLDRGRYRHTSQT